LVLLQSAEDVRSKLKLARRTINGHLPTSASPTLQVVVDHVCRLVESEAD